MGGQFDQIYHEHLSYFTLTALERLLDQHGMKVLDVRLSRVHGGSIMVAAARASHSSIPTGSVGLLRLAERTDPLGLEGHFVDVALSDPACAEVRNMAGALAGRAPFVDAWGAAAKAVTRFAMAKLTHEHIYQCYDDSPLKQGKFLPGSGIPIVPSPEKLDAVAVLLTAWNYERTFRARYPDYKGRVIVP
jgi:novobiocin biosynthesis protein NovU/D-mycarose 3-C-methyltransferase